MQLSEHLLHHATSVQNNAGWAIGELALRAGPEYLDPHVDTIVSKLIGIVNCPELHRSLLQNVCISLVCRDQLSSVCLSSSTYLSVDLSFSLSLAYIYLQSDCRSLLDLSFPRSVYLSSVFCLPPLCLQSVCVSPLLRFESIRPPVGSCV